MRPLKIVLVGDQGIGKTKLVKQHIEKTFCSDPEDDLTELHRSTVEQGRKRVPIVIYDAPAGQIETTTPKNIYSNADVILLCFDVCNKLTLNNIKDRWIPELKSADCANNYQFMLVGTKIDDRDRCIDHDSRRGREKKTVTREEGYKVHTEIKSCVYLECSAKTGDGVNKIFEVASLLALNRKKQKESWFIRLDDWNRSL